MEQKLSAKPFSAIYTSYSISFDGENFVHLKFTDFLKSDVEEWIKFVGVRSQSPIINAEIHDNGLRLNAVDALAPGESWENRLRLHHALGKSFFEKGNPTFAYESFHFGLMLEAFNLQEFNKAWEAESVEMGGSDLREQLAESPDHIKLFRSGSTHGYYFKKTPFVLERFSKRTAAEKAAAQAKERERKNKAILRRQAEEAAKREEAVKAQAKKEADELRCHPSRTLSEVGWSPPSRRTTPATGNW